MPELKNFLRILQREEEEHIKQIVQRYALARTKMQEALAGSTPGWDAYAQRGFSVHLSAGQSPEVDRPSMHSKIPENPTPNASWWTRVWDRARDYERERALARMCMWDDVRDETCLTPGESDVPERMSWENWRLADETVMSLAFGYCRIILHLSCVIFPENQNW